MADVNIEIFVDEKFGLNEKQRLAALERERDVVVTAGAGSGKTLTLVARYTSLLVEGLPPRRIAAITFSIKAAREMRSRVRTKLMALQNEEKDPLLRQKWVDLIAQMDSARISTIHSLCAEILRSHPAEAGIDPQFDVIDESLAVALRQQAVEDSLKQLADDERFTPLLNNMTTRNLRQMLLDLLKDRLDAAEAFKISVCQQDLITNILRKRMNHPLIVELVQALRGMSQNELVDDAGEGLAGMVNEFLEWWSSAEKSLDQGDYIDCAMKLYEIRRTKMNASPGKRDSDVKAMVSELRTHIDTLIVPITGGANNKDPLPSADLEALSAQILPLVYDAFITVSQAYQTLLDSRQALDFDDLEGRALQLLDREDVRSYWQKELDALLVDEFQDTNQRQREIIEALKEKPGKLFIVGDMRQSIYHFRGADVTVFGDVQERIRKEGGLLIDLDLTYRAHQPLLNAMGDLLGGVIGTEPDPAKPYYVPYTPMVAWRQNADEGTKPPHLEFILGAGEDSEQAYPLAARTLAKRLLDLKAEGQFSKWDDVALLFRSSTGYPDYEEAFQEAGIPYVTISGRGFYDRPEIRDLLNILRVLADPQDNLAFAGLLRSPAFGLSDAALYQLKQTDQTYQQTIQGDLSALNETDRTRAERARKIFNSLLPLVDRIPVAELIKTVVDALDYRAILATADVSQENLDAASTGGRLYRNLDKLIDDALASQQLNLRTYLEMIETLNDAGAREGEAPAEAEGAVSLMTIHKAKGLEFKIVVLAAAGRRPRNSSEIAYLDKELGVTVKLDPPPMLYQLAKHIEKDQEDMEALRILYVALTRARHKLIISAHSTLNKKGELVLSAWVKDLSAAARLDPMYLQQANSEPYHFAIKSGEPVYAWCALDDSFSLQKAALAQDQPEQNEPNNYPLYQSVKQEAIILSEKEESFNPDAWRATVRPAAIQGKMLGKLVHKAIQRWIFPDSLKLQGLLETTAIDLGLAAADTRKDLILRAVDLLKRLQEDPFWQELDKASQRYHELPYTYQVNGMLDNRIIDLLYQDATGWHIIDFKTDPIHSSANEEALILDYSTQIRRYKNAIWDLLHIEADAHICFLDDHSLVKLVEVG